MTRTAIILFAITLFVTWYVHVVNRAGNGEGFRPDRLGSDVAFTATVSGALFLLIVTWAVVGVYVRHVRGKGNSAVAVLGPPLLWWTASCLSAFVVGVLLAEWYCVIDEHVFRHEARRYLAHAEVDSATQERPIYARERWWPADAQQLVSDDQ